ncbi:hypothetical protein IGB42_01690 [Andreprevotia sp. IGB-42]|uniref:endonuclease/exonuclease/phosphatase family protein n=1 Tax=Andreprevotia sp. IGB-42 TaxID=2497473 RepID=UPI00135CE52D|nr:endonuclease/exonuclease/phosphatase family protein [Andreprevotia sp. IGB-42]KAF0814011.1 hypothetical protein IGB42_01690 [Andreprevotia sp. IGB-42]
MPGWPGRGLVTLAWLATGASLLGLLGRWHWVPELFSHFALLYLPLLLCGVLVAQRGLPRVVLTVAMLLQCWVVAQPLRLFDRAASSNHAASPLRAASFNLLFSNTRYHEVGTWLAGSHADVIVLTEATPAWASGLSVLLQTYPHGCAAWADGTAGLALLSRQALRSCQINGDAALRGYPYVRAELADGRVVYGVHPPPPLGADLALARNASLQLIAQRLQAERAPVLLLGDFNVTPFSPVYRHFVDEAGLREAGAGLWPSWNHLLPLDRALFAGAVRPVNVWLGPSLGSDHRPLVFDLE